MSSQGHVHMNTAVTATSPPPSHQPKPTSADPGNYPQPLTGVWRTLSVLLVVLLSSVVTGQVLLIHPNPPFAGKEFVKSGGFYYLFSEAEDIHKDGEYERHSPDSRCQHEDFIFIRPEQSIEFEIDVPKAGTYRIWTHLTQHGNTSPTGTVFVDGEELNIINGKGWHDSPDNTGHFLSEGKHTLGYTESSGDPHEWPYSLLPIDAIAVTNDPSYEPPKEMIPHPFDPCETNWYDRPSEELKTISVWHGSERGMYIAESSWTPYDLLILDAEGNTQATTPIIHQGAVKGEGLLKATIRPDPYVEVIRFDQGRLAPEQHGAAITPNNDGITDKVTVEVPELSVGTLQVFTPKGRPVSNPIKQSYTWDGRDSTGAPAKKAPYVLRVSIVGRDKEPLFGVVTTDPTVPPEILTRVPHFSPNGDGIYDVAEIHIGQPDPTNDIIVRDKKTGKGVRSNVDVSYARHWHIRWDGKDNSRKLCPPGEYVIEIREPGRGLRYRAEVELLDREPAPTTPWPVTEYPLGVWFLGMRDKDEAFQDMVEHNCTAFFSSQVLSKEELDLAEKHGLKALVSIAGIIHDEIVKLEQARSEVEIEQALQPFVSRFKDHPAFLGYYIADEPGWNEKRAFRFKVAQQVLRAMDPAHPAVMCILGKGSRSQYATELKVPLLMIDVYPKSAPAKDRPGDFRECFHGGFGTGMMDYIDYYLELVSEWNPPLWLIQQAHKHVDQLVQPTPYEIRLQVWLGLTRATKGIFFFAYDTQQTWQGLVGAHPDFEESERWRILGHTYGRLKPLIPLLAKLQRDPVQAATVEGGGNEYGYANGEIATLTTGIGTYLLIVNRNCTDASAMTIRSDYYDGDALRDLETNENYRVGQPIRVDPGDGKLLEIMASKKHPDSPPSSEASPEPAAD